MEMYRKYLEPEYDGVAPGVEIMATSVMAMAPKNMGSQHIDYASLAAVTAA